MNFTQIFQAELKKAFHTQLHKHKKCCTNDLESDDDSDTVPEVMGRISLGNH